MAAGIYGYGAWSFRQASVYRLFDRWDEATQRGDAQPICDSLAPEMTFSTHNRLGAQVHEQSGDRAEFCAYLNKVVPVAARIMASDTVTREHFTAARHGMHWLTADVSYTEHEELVLKNGLHVKQDTDIQLTMTKTLDGLRVTRLESDSRVVQ